MSYDCSKSKNEQMLYLRSFKIAADILNKVNFVNVWLQVHIHLIFYKRGSIFQGIYDCLKQKFCKLGMNMGVMKIVPVLLIFFRQLVLQEGIFGTAASLIPSFAVNKL